MHKVKWTEFKLISCTVNLYMRLFVQSKKRTLPAICNEGVNPCKGLTLAAFDKVNLHIARPQNLWKVSRASIIIRYFLGLDLDPHKRYASAKK